MSNVIALKGGAVAGEPDADIIAELEMLLDMAKAGALTGIAYGVSKQDNLISTGWVGIAGSRNSLLASVMVLSNRFASAVHNGGE